MYLQLDKVLYTCVFIFTSAVIWYIRRRIWLYRKIPSALFNKKILTAVLTGEFQISKFFENYSTNVLVSLCKILEREGICCWFYIIETHVAVFNEEYVKILLNDSAALDKPLHYKLFSDAVGNGLLTHDGILWKKRRKVINPAFHFEMLKNYVSTFNRCARHAVDRFSMLVDQPTSDVLHIIKTTSLKAICEIVFGKEMNGGEMNRKIAKCGGILARLGSHTVYRALRFWRYFKKLEFLFESGRKHQKDYEECNNFTKYLIEEAMKENTSDLRKDDFERNSLFHMLLRHHLDDPKSFTMENLREEIQTAIIAGHDTVAHAMHWCLIMISLHPEIQQKAFEEVDSAVGSGGADITYEDLNNLKYLDSVIKETMRLYPPVPYFGRLLTKDVQCGKYKIPKSSTICFVVYLLHRNPDIYPNPDKFDPDRFYDKTLKIPWAFVPFAEGIRACIGKNFAMLEMKCFLAYILRNFKLSLEDKDREIRAKWNVVLETAGPVRFLLTRR